MASAADELFLANAEKFNELRKEFFRVGGVDARAFLLKKDGESPDYENLLELTNWYLIFDEFRQQSGLRIARTDSTFLDAWKQASDFSVSTNVYNIQDPRKDKVAPQGRDFFYVVYGDKNGDTFENPVEWVLNRTFFPNFVTTNGSPNLEISLDGAFEEEDEGRRIEVILFTLPSTTLVLDTTILTFVDATHVILDDNFLEALNSFGIINIYDPA